MFGSLGSLFQPLQKECHCLQRWPCKCEWLRPGLTKAFQYPCLSDTCLDGFQLRNLSSSSTMRTERLLARENQHNPDVVARRKLLLKWTHLQGCDLLHAACMLIRDKTLLQCTQLAMLS